ncbi:hypothetical protein [Gemmatimonas sp.]|uniref:hypothetical protein n=1 Tax=Gemmatimonas sp. TaxID=1962908 RepID=UPI00286CB9A0|nr:hypothetical protein [Gemmatimonas sp.]
MRRRLSAVTSAVLLTALTACGDDGVSNSTPQPPRGILVLDGFIQPGLTFLGDTGSASTKLTLGPTTEFDAGGFTLLRDTVLAVSSRGAGDLLYIADVRTSSTRRIQLPTRSNPSRARLLNGSGGQTLIGAALRDSSSIALVSFAGAGAVASTRIANAGTCPTDLFQFDNATWIVDANANCRVNYAVQGDVRLIRVPNTGTVRDTILLPGLRGSGASALVDGDVAYISAGGDASFASFPYTLISTGGITKVDLRGKRVLTAKRMPANTYGAGVKLGLDGFLYVSLYQDLASFTNRIIKVRPADLSFVTSASADWLVLTGATGTAVTCGSGQADALGRLHCIQNGTGSVTSLLVFSPAGTEVRRVAANQGGVDMAIRP